MVDLQQSLRPTGTEPPLPVSEIAARGLRRKRRRLISTTGMAVATMGIAAFVVSGIAGSPADTATVADGGDPSTTISAASVLPSTSATTSEVPSTDQDETAASSEDIDQTTSSIAPNSTARTSIAPNSATPSSTTQVSTVPAEPRPKTTPGLRTTTTTTSEWEDGYCIQIDATNDTAAGNTWQVVLDLDGTIATFWNVAVVEASSGTFVFSGLEDYNATIQPGSVTSFGICMDTETG